MAPAVVRAFRILDLISRSPSPVGTSEVARRLRLPKSTAHGLLRALVEAGGVEAVGTRYRLGPEISRLASVVELRRRWRPALRRIAAETGETAFLGQARGGRVAIIDEVPGSGAPIVSAPVGSFVPAGAGALAKVLAGAVSAEDEGEYLSGVNAAAVRVPGGLLWVAGFESRLPGERLPAVVALLEDAAGSAAGLSLDRP
ncbi:MAG TPA: helix-turn-helix domain-containing protein [Candidatus Dormibacteraeota bacterium]